MTKIRLSGGTACSTAMLAAALLGLGGCGGGGSSATSTADTAAPQRSTEPVVTQIDGGTVQGTLLHTSHIEPGHTVSYFQFDETLQFAIETHTLEQTARVQPSSVTLAQMYADATGETAVPAALRAADAARERALANDAGPSEQAMAAAKTLSLPLPQREQIASSSACSSDVLQDNWSYYWFATNYCFPGGVTMVDSCKVNQVEYDGRSGNYAGFRVSKNFYWVQMEGDFLSKGLSEGFAFHSSDGPDGLRQLWSYAVEPRTVRSANFTAGKGWWFGAHGKSGCGHGHFGIRWSEPKIVTRPA